MEGKELTCKVEVKDIGREKWTCEPYKDTKDEVVTEKGYRCAMIESSGGIWEGFKKVLRDVGRFTGIGGTVKLPNATEKTTCTLLSQKRAQGEESGLTLEALTNALSLE